MNNFRMYVPTDIRFGKDRLNELPEVLASYGKRVLLAYVVVAQSNVLDSMIRLSTYLKAMAFKSLN